MTLTVKNYIEAIDEDGRYHHVTRGKYNIDEAGNFQAPDLCHLKLTETTLEEAMKDGSITEGEAD